MKIVILLEKYGDHCNRLFQSLHYHAYCIENDYVFINLTLLNLLRFDNKVISILDKIINLFLTTLYKLFFKNIFSNRILKSNKRFIKFVGGWDFRENSLTIKHYQKLKSHYLFKKKYFSTYINNLIFFLKNLKSNNNYIVGVHIRRGDYKYWMDGDYFFKDDLYNSIISELRYSLIKENKKPFFIAVSDQEINNDLLCEKKVSGNWIEDQIVLQNCDLLLGPPSTFTMWASYISRIPIIKINKKGEFNIKKRIICDG